MSYEVFPFKEQQEAGEREAGLDTCDSSCPVEIARLYGVELSLSQAEAAVHQEGVDAIVAPAGSGKTMVIAARIASLIRRVGPAEERSIFATSFTREATRNLRSRVNLLLRRESRASISTFHSMAQDIVFSNTALLGYRVQPTVLTRSSAEMRLKSVVLEVTGATKLSDLDDFSLDDVQRWMYGYDVLNLVGGAHLENLGSFLPEARLESTAEAIYRTYHALNLMDCVIDFDELLAKALEVVKKVGAKVFPATYVFVDEAQDLNAVQWEILKLVRPVLKSLVLIGDDDQSIYRFRGAVPQEFLLFVKTAERKFILPENRRSLSRIVSFSDDVMSVVPEGRRVKKTISAVRKEEGEVVFVAPADLKKFFNSELEVIKTRYLSEGDEVLREYAFLQRYSGQPGKILQGLLLAAGLPFVVRGGGSVFDDREAQYVKSVVAATDRRIKIIESLRTEEAAAVHGSFNGSSTFWEQVLDAVGVSSEAVVKIVTQARSLCSADAVTDPGTNPLLFEDHLITAVKASRIKSETKKAILTSIEDVELAVQLVLDDPQVSFKAVVAKINLAETVTDIAKREARRIARARQKRGGLSKERTEEVASELARSRTEGIMSSLGPVFEMPLAEVNARFEVDDEASTGEKEATSRIVISTVHSSKGLEWKKVYLLDLSGQTWPPGWSTGSEEDLDEERRLFYVAVTRARDSLVMVAPGEVFTESGFTPTQFVDRSIQSAMIALYNKASRTGRASAVVVPTLAELSAGSSPKK